MKKLIFFIVIILILIITSCTSNQGNGVRLKQNSKSQTNISKYAENEKAKNIANSILNIPGVKKTVVVVNGKTALIGLVVDNNKDLQKSYYKEMAIQKVKAIDSSISRIQVTLEKDMYDRISKLNDDILNDKPLRGIMRDFKNLLGKK